MTIAKGPTPEYRAWVSMLQRCYNPHNEGFKWYGARGIQVCPEWRQSFDRFLADMGRKPGGREMSLGRIDNDGHYCKENCRWETEFQQKNNKRNNRRLTFEGETLTLAQWARKLKVPRNLLAMRVRMRWSTKRILTTPHLKPPITFKGRTKRPNEWAEETGVPGRVLTERLRRGWSLTRALETPVLDKDEVAARARAGRKPRTHCKRGHSLKDAPNYGRGRVCLPCNRMRGAKWRNKS